VKLDCSVSDIIVADGSNLFYDRQHKWITSLCKNSITTIENLLYSSIWLFYTSGSSSKSYVEHFSMIYHGGCDRQYILTEKDGYVNVSIHGASDIKKMKFDCSLYLSRADKQGFIISFKKFDLFSLKKSSCTSNYLMIYSGNDEINNIPFCDSIMPPEYIDARYGWIRLKIVNNAPVYDIDMVIQYQLLSGFTLPSEQDENKQDTENTYEKKASIIIFWALICVVVLITIGIVGYSFIERFIRGSRLIFLRMARKDRIYPKEELILSQTMDKIIKN
ncbi:hypothetical protein MXB_474, partial [Myxobolus squamalis]